MENNLTMLSRMVKWPVSPVQPHLTFHFCSICVRFFPLNNCSKISNFFRCTVYYSFHTSEALLTRQCQRSKLIQDRITGKNQLEKIQRMIENIYFFALIIQYLRNIFFKLATHRTLSKHLHPVESIIRSRFFFKCFFFNGNCQKNIGWYSRDKPLFRSPNNYRIVYAATEWTVSRIGIVLW